MTVKLLIFLFFFVFGSTVIGVSANFLYVFLVQARLPWVVPVIVLFSLAPLAALTCYQKYLLRRPLGPEEIILGGALSTLLLLFGLTLTFGLRHRLERVPRPIGKQVRLVWVAPAMKG